MTTQKNVKLIWAKNGGLTDPGDVKYEAGWVVEIPTYQNFNYVLNNLSTNMLVNAEQSSLYWDSTVLYKAGAKVRIIETDVVYTSTQSGGGYNPFTNPDRWTKGESFGESHTSLKTQDGVKIRNVNVRAVNVWDGVDITLDNWDAIIQYNTTGGGSNNWLMGNLVGEMCVVDLGTDTVSDGRSIALSDPAVHRLFHEGHPPIQSEVDGTIPTEPQDSVTYGRKNGAWVSVTSNMVSATAPTVLGAGATWYNLEDGQQYTDINDGDSSQWVLSNPPIIPTDTGNLWNTTNLQPSIVEGINTVNLMKNLSGGTISQGANVAGSSLNKIKFDTDGSLVPNGQPAGTWKNITGIAILDDQTALFVRVA